MFHYSSEEIYNLHPPPRGIFMERAVISELDAKENKCSVEEIDIHDNAKSKRKWNKALSWLLSSLIPLCLKFIYIDTRHERQTIERRDFP